MLRTAMGDQTGHVTAFESSIDVDHGYVGGTTIEHPQQCGQTTKTGAVSNTGWHSDHGAVDVATNDTW